MESAAPSWCLCPRIHYLYRVYPLKDVHKRATLVRCRVTWYQRAHHVDLVLCLSDHEVTCDAVLSIPSNLLKIFQNI